MLRLDLTPIQYQGETLVLELAFHLVLDNFYIYVKMEAGKGKLRNPLGLDI